jgi:cellulose synthase/poly-beta-1,6-N-acetylglucosamine synthase-like glycosyltransferase
MKLSFVIPAHNEQAYIAACLESVSAELSANPCEAQVIVVNNASSDNTKEIARAFSGVLVVDEPKKGLSRARNVGFIHSTGDLIANVDADMILPDGWVKTVLDEFRLNENLVALSGPVIHYDLPRMTQALVRIYYLLAVGMHFIYHRILRKGAVLQGGNFVVRRSALERLGGFDEKYDFYGEDTDMGWRIQKLGDVKFTFKLTMYASGRRLRSEGLAASGLRYMANHVWTIVLKRPFTRDARDIRQ